jgi:hypothetical protein
MLLPQGTRSLGLLFMVASLWLPGQATGTNFPAPGKATTSIQETRFVELDGVEQY